jgi:hypothetical protein
MQLKSISPSQGINLGGIGAYSDNFMLINWMKGADAWVFGDGSAERRPSEGELDIDANGWLKSLPVKDGTTEPAKAYVFYTQAMKPTTFIMEWKGEGDIQPFTDYKVIGPNKIKVTFNPDYDDIGPDGQPIRKDDGFGFLINTTDPNKTGNYIRDIKIYEAKYADLIEHGESYNPKWFNKIDDFRVLRTHGSQDTNFTSVTDWSQTIESKDSALWSRTGQGVPYEVLVDIANDAKSDLWITIPHTANDDYIRKAATYIKDNLSKDLRVYVEYSNEYWTEIFFQHKYFNNLGKEKFGDAPFANAQAYAVKAANVADIFSDVFGKADDARLYPVLTVPASADAAEIEAVLNAPANVAIGGKKPIDSNFKHLATDGYFAWFTPFGPMEERIKKWIKQPDQGFDEARDYLIAQIRDEFPEKWARVKSIADKYELSMGVYEGGALLQNTVNDDNPNPVYTDYNHRFYQSKEMAEVYKAALQEWQKIGGQAFAWFADVGRAGFYGDYGLWNGPDFKPEPRTNAIIDANSKPAWWNDGRDPAVFKNGRYDMGGTKSDIMTGTALGDRLYGLAGDDALRGLAGNDLLVGGLGIDRLVGAAGDDHLDGGEGRDRLNGGTGSDRIDGDLGNDLLTGGADRDIFQFRKSADVDKITDFTDKIDKIEVTGLSAEAAKTAITVTKSGSATLIRIDWGDTTSSIRLENTKSEVISLAEDFIFS